VSSWSLDYPTSLHRREVIFQSVMVSLTASVAKTYKVCEALWRAVINIRNRVGQHQFPTSTASLGKAMRRLPTGLAFIKSISWVMSAGTCRTRGLSSLNTVHHDRSQTGMYNRRYRKMLSRLCKHSIQNRKIATTSPKRLYDSTSHLKEIEKPIKITDTTTIHDFPRRVLQ
jgi:hypothetical protein